MKKKTMLGLALAGMLAVGAGIGTTAFYSDKFENHSNEIHAAKWEVNSSDFTKNKQFNFEKIYPGMQTQERKASFTRTNEVPGFYKIKIDLNGILDSVWVESSCFLGKDKEFKCPIKVKLHYNGKTYDVDKNNWEQVIEFKECRKNIFGNIIPVTEDIKLTVEWPKGNGEYVIVKGNKEQSSDNLFQNRTKDISLTVEALQYRN